MPSLSVVNPLKSRSLSVPGVGFVPIVAPQLELASGVSFSSSAENVTPFHLIKLLVPIRVIFIKNDFLGVLGFISIDVYGPTRNYLFKLLILVQFCNF